MAGVVRPTTVIRNTGTVPDASSIDCCVGFGTVCADATTAVSTPHTSNTAPVRLIMRNLLLGRWTSRRQGRRRVSLEADEQVLTVGDFVSAGCAKRHRLTAVHYGTDPRPPA